MKFLKEIVNELLNRENISLDSLTMVFPNRRAGLFFQKYLTERIEQPVWSPGIMSIVDFIKTMTPLTVPDRLSLVFELYQTFTRTSGAKESFDKFYFWGETLLRDFDEIDKFLVNPMPLFRNLADLKDLENATSYLNDRQKQLIKSFWNTFDKKISKQQKDFISVWNVLYKVYESYRSGLFDKHMAYEGMIYRKVAEEMQKGSFADPYQTVIFAGFNALSPAEETIITWYVQNRNAKVYWDADDYYLKNDRQEAGMFMRKIMSSNDVLAGTFKNAYGNRFKKTANKKITLIGTPLRTGQAQVASSLLSGLSKTASLSDTEDQTALVLPDEQLLFPVLNALPHTVKKVNITMGFPLRHSLVYSFIENLIKLQMTRAGGGDIFHYQPVIALLQHPFISGIEAGHIHEVIDKIHANNKIYIPSGEIAGEVKLLRQIFIATGTIPELINYIRILLVKFAESGKDTLQQEFLLHFYAILNRLKDFIETTKLKLDEESFLKLFRQLVNVNKLPFEGEPLEGLQVMGAMETRNLDFDRIIIFSMNEGIFPPSRPAASFIPYNLRQAFELPVFDHQEAMYAYIFYRMIQRAGEIYLIYDTSEHHGLTGEVSRFVKQLQFELKNILKVESKIVAPPIPAYSVRNLSVLKNPSMVRKLDRYINQKGNDEYCLSPSALNTYQECNLRFYFRYILGLSEEDEVQEGMDPVLFGKIFHKTMELAYKNHNIDGNRKVLPGHIVKIKKNIGGFVEEAFRYHFDQGKAHDHFDFYGQNIIIREIVKKMALKLLDYDLKYAPFEILGLEKDPGRGNPLKIEINRHGEKINVNIGGTIDRIDKRGKVVRILDYKTGRDKKEFQDIHSLFHLSGEEKTNSERNKAAFQTFLYGMIYKYTVPEFEGKIEAGLFNVREIYKKDFNYLLIEKQGKSKKIVDDITPYLPAFEKELKKLLEEIFSFEGTYYQTDDENKCKYCAYRDLCRKGV